MENVVVVFDFQHVHSVGQVVEVECEFGREGDLGGVNEVADHIVNIASAIHAAEVAADGDVAVGGVRIDIQCVDHLGEVGHAHGVQVFALQAGGAGVDGVKPWFQFLGIAGVVVVGP